jgi:DNA-binding MarR family transcriptional regulator
MCNYYSCKLYEARPGMKKDPSNDGAAFLLAQVGAHAGAKFAARMQAIDLTPPLVGVLRFLARNPRSTQRELAEAIGMPASRLVAMIDELERRKFVGRVRDDEDRRSHRITLTAGAITGRAGAACRVSAADCGPATSQARHSPWPVASALG